MSTDSFGSTGLTVQTLTDLISGLTAALQSIYGNDINLDSNSPDGQLVNIFSQAGVDLRELLVDLNSSFDPDQAEGIVLDQRVALNGIKRNAGTFSQVTLQITATMALSLIGLDSQSGQVNPSVSGLYVVLDDAQNAWYLLASQSISAAGTYNFVFRAANMGPVDASVGSITTPQTIVAGISSVTNPAAPSTIGLDEESDTALKVRRRISIGISGTGFTRALKAALLNVAGVVTAEVSENTSSSTDVYGTPAHSIWCVVQGGAPADIANAIYSKKSAGCGMRGSQSYAVTNPDGSTYTVYWDVPTQIPLYIKFTLALPGGLVDTSYVAAQIVANVTLAAGEDAVGDDITYFLKTLNINYRVTGMLLSSDNTNWYEIVACPSLIDQFVLDASRITIS